MEESIKKISEQFAYEPVIENQSAYTSSERFILGGMGGSHLAADILKTRRPGIELYVHRNYGLPPFDEDFLKSALCIASSYSGNTEETLSFFNEAYQRGLNVMAISTGGELLERAKELGRPYIELPQTGIQPRMALGYFLIALATIIGDKEVLSELGALATDLKSEESRVEAVELAKSLENHIPVIYTSAENVWIAYNWKIKFNETSKIPAFYNVIPEVNHNEMTGFDSIESTRKLSAPFRFIFIKDSADHPLIRKRMDILEKLLEERGHEVISRELSGKTQLERIFNSLTLADWTALELSTLYSTEPEAVPMVESFKKMLMQ
jgi:glucose/mannose-6-phosphate isomerase